ncbi:hypothetical protein [Streptomyces megasporus]|uniref:hypothetical protein n=1 Tax=Streptomyces megasporus TaxID=44060 RepID=UPI000B1FA720|nr:hypothetical protein [Streptomyces megasporus]
MQLRTVRAGVRLRPGRTLAAAAVLGLCVSACSTPPEKEYATPDALCGTSVPADRLEPFLPAGKEVSTRPGAGGVDGIERCRLHVDGREVLSVTTEWWEKGTGVREAAASMAGLSGRDAIGLNGDEKVTEEPPHLYSRTGAITEVVCVKPRKPDQELFASVRISGGRTPGATEVKEFIAAYAEAVGKSDECA